MKKNPAKKSVFVGNLSFDVTEEQLRVAFKDCGEIVNVRIIRDAKTNVGKGFGYVEFTERAAIPLAKKINGMKIGGRIARVQKCVDSGTAKAKATEISAKIHSKGNTTKKPTTGFKKRSTSFPKDDNKKDFSKKAKPVSKGFGKKAVKPDVPQVPKSKKVEFAAKPPAKKAKVSKK
eukprot:Partr_v1_DN25486_c0_g1_i2_m53782 putative RNA binding motif protein 34